MQVRPAHVTLFTRSTHERLAYSRCPANTNDLATPLPSPNFYFLFFAVGVWRRWTSSEYRYISGINVYVSSLPKHSHNDLAWQIRFYFHNQLDRVNLSRNTSGLYGNEWQTDIPRLRAGKVGGQVSQCHGLCAWTIVVTVSQSCPLQKKTKKTGSRFKLGPMRKDRKITQS